MSKKSRFEAMSPAQRKVVSYFDYAECKEGVDKKFYVRFYSDKPFVNDGAKTVEEAWQQAADILPGGNERRCLMMSEIDKLVYYGCFNGGELEGTPTPNIRSLQRTLIQWVADLDKLVPQEGPGKVINVSVSGTASAWTTKDEIEQNEGQTSQMAFIAAMLRAMDDFEVEIEEESVEHVIDWPEAEEPEEENAQEAQEGAPTPPRATAPVRCFDCGHGGPPNAENGSCAGCGSTDIHPIPGESAPSFMTDAPPTHTTSPVEDF